MTFPSPIVETMVVKMLEMMIIDLCIMPICKVEEKKVEEESKVELKRDSGGLGLSIVGGSDTPLVSNIEPFFITQQQCS